MIFLLGLICADYFRLEDTSRYLGAMDGKITMVPKESAVEFRRIKNSASVSGATAFTYGNGALLMSVRDPVLVEQPISNAVENNFQVLLTPDGYFKIQQSAKCLVASVGDVKMDGCQLASKFRLETAEDFAGNWTKPEIIKFGRHEGPYLEDPLSMHPPSRPVREQDLKSMLLPFGLRLANSKPMAAAPQITDRFLAKFNNF